MQMIPVNSSNLVAAGYNEQSQELYIEFHSGSYVYSSVPKSVYEQLMHAPSHGEYHAAHIKNVYRYRKLN